jgi:hypothetical protein
MDDTDDYVASRATMVYDLVKSLRKKLGRMTTAEIRVLWEDTNYKDRVCIACDQNTEDLFQFASPIGRIRKVITFPTTDGQSGSLSTLLPRAGTHVNPKVGVT